MPMRPALSLLACLAFSTGCAGPLAPNPVKVTALTAASPSPAPCGNTLDLDTAYAIPAFGASVPTVDSVNIHLHARQVLADPPEGIPFNANGELTIADNTGTTLHGRVLHIAISPVNGAVRDTTVDITGVLDCGAFFRFEATDAGPTNGIFGFGSHLNFVGFNGAIVVAAGAALGLSGMVVPYSFVGAVPLTDGNLAARQGRPCIGFLFGGFSHP